MKISFSEPSNPRYIYVNPETNKVHLMLPIVGGVDIGTDNTCKTVYAMKEFFGDEGAMKSLEKYKTALENDIGLLPDGDNIRIQKLARLEQINKYIETLSNVQENNPQISDMREIYYPQYPDAIKKLIADSGNFNYMLLCPGKPDRETRGENHIFSVNREYDPATQKNTGVLASTLESEFKDFKNVSKTATEKLMSAVIDAHNGDIDFDKLLVEINAKSEELFGISLVFTEPGSKNKLTKSYFEDILMVIDENSTLKDYVENVLNCCAGELNTSVQASPFDGVTTADKLSITMQFYLAQINLYCSANKLSDKNFGSVLEGDKKMSTELAKSVKAAIESGKSVESVIMNFVNEHGKEFGLENPLTTEQKRSIDQKFTSQLAVIKDSPHFDEFCVLDDSKPGKIMTHQGAICADFAEVVLKMPEINYDENFIKNIVSDYKSDGPREIKQTNDFVKGSVTVDENAIGITINKMLNDNKVSSAAALLMSPTDNGKRLFEQINNETFQLLSEHKRFNTLKQEFVDLKVDQNAVQNFNKRVSESKPNANAAPPTIPKPQKTAPAQSSLNGVPIAPPPPPKPSSYGKLYSGGLKQAPAPAIQSDPDISILRTLSSSFSVSNDIAPAREIQRANIQGLLPSEPALRSSRNLEVNNEPVAQTITVKNQ